MAKHEDGRLIRRLQAGDRSAFDTLFDTYRRGLLAYVTGMIGDRGVAEEIVQDCFLRLVQNIDRLRPTRGVSGWLYRTARNRAIDVGRHRRFEVLPGNEAVAARMGETATPAPDPAEQVMRQEEAVAVRAAVDRLAPDERDLVLLRFFGGLTFREIAKVLNRPLGTVLWKGKRCLEKLNDVMGDVGTEESEGSGDGKAD